MILTNRQIVLMPTLVPRGLGVALDRAFANACLAHTLVDARWFAGAVWRAMGNLSLITAPSNLLDMQGTSILPKGIYANRDGLWLTLDMDTLAGEDGTPLQYHGHNAEHLEDRFWLLTAIQAWAIGAMTLLDWK